MPVEFSIYDEFSPVKVRALVNGGSSNSFISANVLSEAYRKRIDQDEAVERGEFTVNGATCSIQASSFKLPAQICLGDERGSWMCVQQSFEADRDQSTLAIGWFRLHGFF